MYFISTIENDDDRAIVERLYQKYRNILFDKAKAILNDDSLSEDAVQESFIKVINNLNKIDRKNCSRTYNFLVIICENTSKSIYRKNKKIVSYVEELDEEAMSVGDASFLDPLDIIIDNDSARRLMEKILSLPPASRDVILLKTAHRCSLNEIAYLLGIPIETAKKRLHRARKMLSEYLRRERIK